MAKKSPTSSGIRALLRAGSSLLLILISLSGGFLLGQQVDLGLSPFSPQDQAAAPEAENQQPSPSSPQNESEQQAVHPGLSLSARQLDLLLEKALNEHQIDIGPEDAGIIRAAVAERRQVFLQLLMQILKEGDPDLLVRADKNVALGPGYEPGDLVDLNNYADRLLLNRNDLSLRAMMLPQLFAMVEAAALEGISLDLSSTYRSYAYQEGLFQRWVDQLGEEEASRVSARAGTSQHQLGTTIDFGSVTEEYATHPAGIWLAENGGRFGFSLSYPRGKEGLTGYVFEPWHYRYIGREAVRLQEEFFLGLQQYLLLVYNSIVDELVSALVPSVSESNGTAD